MAVKFTNNAATTLAAGINSSVTSISVTDGSVFPALTGSDHFYVTFDDTTNREIVKVTARSGNTLTVVRGQDDTTAQAFNSGDKAELRVVAALLEDITTEVTSTLSVDTFTGDGTTTAFTLSQAPSSEDNLIVFIEGAYQNPGDFVLSGTTLTLDEAPVVDRNIIVYHVKGAVSGNNLNQDSFIADGNTAAFTLSIAPIHENNTQVFIDGVYQQKNSYSISGTTLTLDANPSNGATVEVMTFTQTEVNTLPASFVSGLTQVTAVGADHFMIFDATDSALKKSLVSDVLESATSISTSADATAITIDSNEKVTFTSDVTTGGHLSVGGSNNELRFYEGSNYVGFEAPALSADKIWVLPAADGSSGQVISTDGSGNLSFATVSGTTINNNADNRIITGSGTANTLEGEANLTFDGTNLGINTSSPNDILDIHAANSQLRLTDTDDSKFVQFSYSGGKLLVRNNSTTSTTTQFTLTEDGAFGIATHIPEGQLEVKGTRTVSGSGAGAIFNSTITPTNNNTASIVAVTGTMNAAASLNANSKISGLRINPTFPSSMNGSGHCAGIKIDSFDGKSATIGAGIYAEATTGADTNFAGYFADTDIAVGSANKILGLAFTGDSSASSAYYVYMTDANSVTGSIQGGAGNSVNFNTTSDRRLKENIVDASSQLETINNIQVREFDWKYCGHHQVGVIAQELETIVPDAVSVGGEDENKNPYGVDYGKLTPYLIKAIQEQQTIIDDLKSRIETLEG